VYFIAAKLVGLAPFAIGYLFVPSSIILAIFVLLAVSPIMLGGIAVRMVSPIKFILREDQLDCVFLFRTHTIRISELYVEDAGVISGLTGALVALRHHRGRCLVYEKLDRREDLITRLLGRGASDRRKP
jgi:hypothetical protein